MAEPQRWRLALTAAAKRDLRRLAAVDQDRILEAIEELRPSPFVGSVRKLAGHENEWRPRIGR